jgi:hypothetical protein
MRYVIWTAPLLALATPVFAQQMSADTTATAPTLAVAPAKPKKVCRKFSVTGRRISETQCYTAAQWAEYDRSHNEAANKLINDVSSAGARSDFNPSSSGGLSTSSLFGLGPQ